MDVRFLEVSQMYDIVLTGGLVVDGTGKAPYKANVCVSDGKIAAITQDAATGKEALDVSGLAVAPGFIDIHSHSDAQPIKGIIPENYLRQGVTTQVVGNCGTAMVPTFSLIPGRVNDYPSAKRNHPGFESVSDYLSGLTEAQPLANYATLAGHSNLRSSVIGYEDRIPTPAEMELMCQRLDEEMARGAFGMSLGLIYPPSSFAEKEELVALAKVIAKRGGILSVHMRNEGPRIFEAVEEMLQIARLSGVHLQISHLKLMGKPQWGKAPQLTAMIEKAKAQGVNVTCDQYPFPASSTNLTALVPRWAANGGTQAMLARVEARESTVLADIAQEMDNRGGPDCVLVVGPVAYKTYVGKNILQISQELKLSPEEAVRQVLLDTKGSAKCIYFSINEEDIRHIMAKEWVCVGSDGSDFLLDKAPVVHPRNFATFSQYFQTVREYKILPLEKMVQKATGLTASILGLTDRGTLEAGKWADICVFDPERFATQSTFLAPQKPPVGMYHVLVNGRFAVKNEVLTMDKCGKALGKG